MILPPLMMQPSRPPHEEQGRRLRDEAFLYASSGEAVDVGIEMKDSRRNTIEFTLASARTQATQKSAARPKDQTESCETRKSAARPPQSTGHAESDGTCPKRKKRTHTQGAKELQKKIKARAWRNQSKREIKARDGEKIKTKPRR